MQRQTHTHTLPGCDTFPENICAEEESSPLLTHRTLQRENGSVNTDLYHPLFSVSEFWTSWYLSAGGSVAMWKMKH